jgi:hypothetical protein
MVVTTVQDYIAAGQLRGGEQLVEAQSVARSSFISSPFKGGLAGGDGRQQLYRQRLRQQSR